MHRAWTLRGAAACLLLASGLLRAADIDTAASHIGFILATRWGQVLEGNFPQYRGQVTERSDGRHQVRLQLDARAVEIVGHAGYTRFARGGGFFDVADWPHVAFVSEPYAPALLRGGGDLAGALTIRGITRREVFRVQPAACERPGLDCDTVVTGSIARGDFGMTRWRFAVSDAVVFQLRIRIRPEVAR